MSYKIVFFDIDGTLVNEEKEIPKDTKEAIADLKKRGIEPVIATGRAPYFFKSIADALQIESFVSLNGAYVVFKGEVLHNCHIPKQDLEILVKTATANKHSLVFQGKEAYYANAQDHPFIIESVNSLQVDLPGYNPDYWQTEDIYQAFLHCERHEEHLYQNILSNLRMIRWHDTAMDVLPIHGSKAVGIKALLDHLGFSTSEAVAFGDGLNDKEMLSLVGLGIAMGNAVESLKPYADYVTAHVNEGGIHQGLIFARLID